MLNKLINQPLSIRVSIGTCVETVLSKKLSKIQKTPQQGAFLYLLTNSILLLPSPIFLTSNC